MLKDEQDFSHNGKGDARPLKTSSDLSSIQYYWRCGSVYNWSFSNSIGSITLDPGEYSILSLIEEVPAEKSKQLNHFTESCGMI